jgi:hypothetical protein
MQAFAGEENTAAIKTFAGNLNSWIIRQKLKISGAKPIEIGTAFLH